jgi:hypothetical protein
MLQQLPRRGKTIFTYGEHQYAEKGFLRIRKRTNAKTASKNPAKYTSISADTGELQVKDTQKGNPESVQYLLCHRSLN